MIIWDMYAIRDRDRSEQTPVRRYIEGESEPSAAIDRRILLMVIDGVIEDESAEKQRQNMETCVRELSGISRKLGRAEEEVERLRKAYNELLGAAVEAASNPAKLDALNDVVCKRLADDLEHIPTDDGLPEDPNMQDGSDA